jgi:hypothetical protein
MGTFFFNFIGIGLVVLGILAAIFLGPALGHNSELKIAGLTMAAGDLVYRTLKKSAWEITPFFKPNRGGYIMYIPIWIVGALIFIIGLSS